MSFKNICVHSFQFARCFSKFMSSTRCFIALLFFSIGWKKLLIMFQNSGNLNVSSYLPTWITQTLDDSIIGSFICPMCHWTLNVRYLILRNPNSTSYWNRRGIIFNSNRFKPLEIFLFDGSLNDSPTESFHTRSPIFSDFWGVIILPRATLLATRQQVACSKNEKWLENPSRTLIGMLTSSYVPGNSSLNTKVNITFLTQKHSKLEESVATNTLKHRWLSVAMVLYQMSCPQIADEEGLCALLSKALPDLNYEGILEISPDSVLIWVSKTALQPLLRAG